jgi:hypothetical protein
MVEKLELRLEEKKTDKYKELEETKEDKVFSKKYNNFIKLFLYGIATGMIIFIAILLYLVIYNFI